MKIEIPDFLIEMSERMNTDDDRITSHPFWQVRHIDYLPTEGGYSEHHFEIIDDELYTVYRSDEPDIFLFAKYVQRNHNEFFNDIVQEYHEDNDDLEIEDMDAFVKQYSFDYHELPDDLSLLHFQEIEKIVWTGLTQSGAEQFIKRQQHNYPKLYTHVESAYWSPEFRQLQDWIKSLTGEKNNG